LLLVPSSSVLFSPYLFIFLVRVQVAYFLSARVPHLPICPTPLSRQVLVSSPLPSVCMSARTPLAAPLFPSSLNLPPASSIEVFPLGLPPSPLLCFQTERRVWVGCSPRFLLIPRTTRSAIAPSARCFLPLPGLTPPDCSPLAFRFSLFPPLFFSPPAKQRSPLTTMSSRL